MGGLRSRLAKSAIDRDVQREVEVASRAIERALRICRTAKRGQGVESKRSYRVARDLSRVKSALGGVGRLTPLYDLDDPDLVTEDERSQQMWAAREAEREAKEAEDRAAEESVDEDE